MNRVLLTSLFLFIISTVSFACLSYNLNESVSQEKSLRLQAEAVLADNAKSLELSKEVCVVTDVIVSDYTDQLKFVDRVDKGLVDKIVSIPIKPKQETKTNVQDNSIDIDSALPDDLTRVLRESYLQRETDTSPAP